MMRAGVAVVLAIGLSGLVLARPQGEMRYGVALDLKTYPQATPQEALGSVARAIEARRVDYVLAYLADPRTVDAAVRNDFDDFVPYVRFAEGKLTPAVGKLFARFVAEGEWKVEGDTARASLKDVKDRAVFLRKVDGRWRVETRQKAE